MNKEEYIKREEGAMLHTYNRFPVVLEKGEGVYLYDTDGKKYLDFAAGIADLPKRSSQTVEQRRSRVRSRRRKSMLIPETAIRIMRSLL